MNELSKQNYLDDEFYMSIKEILITARNHAYRAVNFTMVQAYWEIGKSIVEKQGGAERSEYGKGLIKELSIQMTKDFGKGYGVSNLKNMRQFYLKFQNRQTVSGQLSWSHYLQLIKIENEHARHFYLNECIECNWSTRQLERQINSFYYERLLSSKDKVSVSQEIYKLEPKRIDPKDVIKDPYVLEFLDINQNDRFYESDLENALINHLQKFILELGKGFCFVGRQKRITIDDEHFYIDLVFYNYILRCFVLIDLKTGKLTHQDLGQMSMYVNYYTRELMNEYDSKPIGLVLCANKSDSIVKYTLPEDNDQIYASKYQLCLPSVDELKKELMNEYKLLQEIHK